MNIKKMGRLLSMCAFASVAGLNAKADETKPDVMEDIFGQERLAVLSTNGVVVSFANGYHWIQTNDNQVVTNYYPVLVEAENCQKGFAVAHTNMPDLADIAVDSTSGKVYGLPRGNSSHLYELNLSNVSSNKMMDGRIELKSQGLEYYVDQSPTTINADRLLAFGGKWLVVVDTTENETGMSNAALFHMNEVISHEDSWQLPNPKYICETVDNFYVSDGKTTVQIDKNNPNDTNAYGAVCTNVTGIVGMASIGTNLYQATINTVYKNGKECVFSVTTTALTGETRVFNRIADLASDGKNLYLSHEGNVSGETLTFSGTSNIVYVSDAPQLISSHNTVYKKVGNQLQKIKE